MKLHPFTIVSRWDMIEINVASVSNALAHLSSYWRILENRGELSPGAVRYLNQEQLSALAPSVEVLMELSRKISAPVTLSNCDSLVSMLTQIAEGGGRFDERIAVRLVQTLGAIVNSFPAESETKKAFIIDNRHSDFYVGANEPLHFGDRALKAFPSIIYEVSEASNCIALGRWTASVMHLMRSMEVPLHALAKKLSVSVAANPNWQNILDQIDCEAKKATKAGMGADEFQFIKETTSHLRSVKDAFRNHAMHRKTKYDEERAMAIWSGSKSFMAHLSTRLSE